MGTKGHGRLDTTLTGWPTTHRVAHAVQEVLVDTAGPGDVGLLAQVHGRHPGCHLECLLLVLVHGDDDRLGKVQIVQVPAGPPGTPLDVCEGVGQVCQGGEAVEHHPVGHLTGEGQHLCPVAPT